MNTFREALALAMLSACTICAPAHAAASDQSLGTTTCVDTHTIAQLQGNAAISPLVSIETPAPIVTTRGVVYARRADGFYMQMAVGDGDDTTSDGIFVFTGVIAPPDAAVGNEVCVTGPLMEVVADGDATNLPVTQIRNPSSVVALSTGNPLPLPVVITAEATMGGHLESLEGMRVQIDELTVVGPTQGDTTGENERNATATSNGVFYGVVKGVPRPFREAGLPLVDVGTNNTVQAFSEQAAPVTVYWDPSASADVQGYVVMVGTRPWRTERLVDVKQVLSCTLTGLATSRTYYVWAHAYDRAGRMSPASEVLQFTTSGGPSQSQLRGAAGVARTCPLDPECAVPVFDGNEERVRVDSPALGGRAVDVSTGMVVTGLVGPFDYAGHAYSLLPEYTPAIAGVGKFSAVPPRSTSDMTFASLKLRRFFDTFNEIDVADAPLLGSAYANTLAKASLTIRNVLRSPDVIAVQGVETYWVLRDIAEKINRDLSAANDPPVYAAFLSEGNDPDGLDVGFLVNVARIEIVAVDQFLNGETWVGPAGVAEPLYDWPPLILRATAVRPNGSSFAFTAVTSQLVSPPDVSRDPAVTGDPDRTHSAQQKRRAEAEGLARLVQELQAANPAEPLILLGDFEAPAVSDGYVDVMGTLTGRPAPPNQVILPSDDLVEPDLVDVVQLLPSSEQYSVVIDGTAQPFDHALVNAAMRPWIGRVAYGRSNADFPEAASYRGDPTRPERLSDHDALVVSVGLGSPRLKVWAVTVSDNGLAVVRVQNIGGATARNVTVDQVIVYEASGSSMLTYTGPKPFAIGDLGMSESRTVELALAATGPIDQCFVSLSVTFLDPSGARIKSRMGVYISR